MIKWPAVIPPGRVVHEPVIRTDLYPTLLAATGLPNRPHQHQDGINLLPVICGEQPLAFRSLFWHYPHFNEHPSSVPSSVIRKGPWKLIESFDPERIELYNLSDDLDESNHRAGQEPARVSGLRSELEAWRNYVGAERMTPNPDYDPAAEKPNRKKRA